MDAQLIYNARSDVLRASFVADIGEAIAVPLRDLVILLSATGEVLAIDVIDFTGFVRKYVQPDSRLSGEALFQAVRPELTKMLAPWFSNIGPLAAECAGKWDAPLGPE
jgi:hypothetical protein